MSERPDEADVAARLIERLLTDPVFRVRFRRNPEVACREAGLDELAEEMALGAGNAMMTLDLRESKSSLAGVMMAAAMEGIGVYEFTKHVVPQLDGLEEAVGDVLSRVDLPAIRGGLAGGPEPPPAALPAEEAEEAEGAVPPGAAPAASAAAPQALPSDALADDGAGAEAAEEEGEAGADAGGGDKADAGDGGFPEAEDFTRKELRDEEPKARAAGGSGGGTVSAEPASEPEAAAAPAAEEEPAEPSRKPDPSEYGREGTGGPVTPEVKALLDNPKVTFDADGISDLKAGMIDPRAVAVLTKLSEEHEITVTCMCTDHPKGPASNHYYGRGIDIGTIDGQLVRPGSSAARELASAVADLPPSLRPSEVGTPFAIAAPGFFTDSFHQDHVHLGWDDPITPDWKPPADLQGDQPTTQATTTPTDTPTPTGQPAQPTTDSATFQAITPDTTEDPTDSGTFTAVGPEEAGESEDAAPSEPDEPVRDLSGAPADYPGDDAPKEKIAAWMAKEAEKRGIPGELPVMAALVESNLQNLDYGHSTSLGYFQMLEHLWNKGEYAGYPDNPELQLKWFLDTAEQVKAQRVAAGKPIDDPTHYGEWIADVERPAAQYRGRYQLRLAEARRLISS